MSTQAHEKTIDEVIKVSVDDNVLTHINTATTLAETVRSLKITNSQEHQNSAEFLKQIKTVSKVIDDCRKDITKPLDEIIIIFSCPCFSL